MSTTDPIGSAEAGVAVGEHASPSTSDAPDSSIGSVPQESGAESSATAESPATAEWSATGDRSPAAGGSDDREFDDRTPADAGGREDLDGPGDAPGGAENSDDDESEASENPLDVEAEVAADYLEELLDIADLDGDIDTYVDGDRAQVSIVSESTTLVGGDGEVLDALQELTRLAVLAETGQRSRLMLDVAGYRARRRTQLVELAGDAVQEAKETAEPVHLKAMNPFERKIVHDAVAAAGLTSESEGEEPRRHVVVLPNRG